MAGIIKLCSSGHTGRTGTYDGNLVSGSHFWLLCLHKTLVESDFNDMFFNFFNRYGWLINPQNTRAFTWCGTNSTCKLREIVCGREDIISFFPTLTIHRIVKFRYNVSQGASTM